MLAVLYGEIIQPVMLMLRITGYWWQGVPMLLTFLIHILF